MTGTRAVIAAAGVALVLGVAACSGSDPEPRVAPPTSTPPNTPPSTTAASDPLPPTMPAAAKGTDAASAEAFVKFYWEMVNYAQATGDVSGLRRISSPHCVACRAGIAFLVHVFSKQGSVEGGAGRVSKLKAVFLNGKPRNAIVEFNLTNSRQLIDYPGTSDDVVYKGGTSHLRAVLLPTGSSWTMSYWGKQ